MKERIFLQSQPSHMKESPSDNLYENVAVVGKRARVILTNNTKVMLNMIEELGPSYEDEEQVFDKARIALVNKCDRKAKPFTVASKECEQGELLYSYRVPAEKEGNGGT